MGLDKTKIYERHYEDSVFILAGAAEIFAFIDHHTHLSSHMNKSSWMMGGGRMETSVDDRHGQEVGSHIRMNGRFFWIMLSLDEVITRREPPRAKVWETVGTPKLLVVGHYRMTVKIEPRGDGSLLRVSIDYDLPTENLWLGKLFSGIYAKWCVQQMIKDVYNHLR